MDRLDGKRIHIRRDHAVVEKRGVARIPVVGVEAAPAKLGADVVVDHLRRTD